MFTRIKIPFATIGCFEVTNHTWLTGPTTSFHKFKDGSFIASFAVSRLCIYIKTQ